MEIKKVYEKGLYEYYKYIPSFFKPFYIKLEKLTLRRRVRLLIAFFVGYSVYYLVKDDKYIGYCLVQSGKDVRYKFATEDDIIVGPYYIVEDYRGKKLSIELLNYVLRYSGIKYNNAYDYIGKDNIASIRASEAVGFKYMSDANLTSILRRIILCKEGSGEYLIFKHSEKL